MSFTRVTLLFFFFNDTATTEIYTLSLHDALPICAGSLRAGRRRLSRRRDQVLLLGCRWGRLLRDGRHPRGEGERQRSEEHTSELQSRQYLVCRLLLEKKKKNIVDARRQHTLTGSR